MKLSEKKAGEVFKTKTKEFIVLEQFDNGTTAILQKDFWKKVRFDRETSNFAKAEIFKDLNENYYKELADVIGAENIVEHEVDLIMDTGHKDYGTVKAQISLLTADLFRRYVEILDDYNPHNWWWLATADSRQFSSFVRCVNDDGALDSSACVSNRGVRPFLILKSDILESNEE